MTERGLLIGGDPDRVGRRNNRRWKVMFGILLTCMATWRERELDPTEQLLKAPRGRPNPLRQPPAEGGCNTSWSVSDG